jgi:hypothetical protein
MSRSFTSSRSYPTLRQVLFSLHTPYVPPRASPIAMFAWRQRIWVESTFGLVSMEPWEKIIVGQCFGDARTLPVVHLALSDLQWCSFSLYSAVWPTQVYSHGKNCPRPYSDSNQRLSRYKSPLIPCHERNGGLSRCQELLFSRMPPSVSEGGVVSTFLSSPFTCRLHDIDCIIVTSLILWHIQNLVGRWVLIASGGDPLFV